MWKEKKNLIQVELILRSKTNSKVDGIIYETPYKLLNNQFY